MLSAVVLRAEINDEVVQDQPWTWNDVKYAVAMGKLKPPLVALNVDSTNDSEEQSSSRTSAAKSAAGVRPGRRAADLAAVRFTRGPFQVAEA